MHVYRRLAATALLLTLSALLAACGGIDITTSDPQRFSAGDYQYYKWRTEPLPQDSGSRDLYYLLDPIMRRQVDATLAAKGYQLDPERAQFSVDYVYAPGVIQGAQSEQASNISPTPSVTANRQVDGASVDNAIALAGVKETDNILLQFNDVASRKEVWRAVISKIVENSNRDDTGKIRANVEKAVNRALRDLPKAS